jgi:phosphatidylinositol-3-phosphatase
MRSALGSLLVVLCALFAEATVPRVERVFIVVLENTSYGSVVGSSSMPYLNSLASKYGLAVKYYGNTHPSIGNYFMLTTGQILTNNDYTTNTYDVNNVARRLITAGKTWKVYAESLPYTGYIGGDKYPYIKHHNPFVYFTDVRNSSVQRNNVAPFTQFPTDRKNGALPNYSFIVPNNQHNMHDCPPGMSSCTLAQKAKAADDWLKANLAPLVNSSAFQQSGDILIITWDEGFATDKAYGGGHIAWVVVSSKARKGYHSGTFHQHQSTLKLTLKALGVYSYPGASQTATDMGELFP